MKYFIRFYDRDMCVAETAKQDTDKEAIANAWSMLLDHKALEHCTMWLWRTKENGATIRTTLLVGKYDGGTMIDLIPNK